MFGGNQASDLQRAGPQLGQASDSLFALYERKATEANESRVQDLNNRFVTRMQDVLRTGPDAFHKLEGADAIQAAGATTETLKKFKAEIFGQTVNGYQRNRLAPILDTHFASATEQIARHVDQQQQVYERNVAATSIKVAEREAISNPGNLAGAVTRAVGAVRVLHKGQAPEAIESELRKAASRVVSSLIRDRLVRDDPSAVGLYRQHEGRLGLTDRTTLGMAVETLSNSMEAAKWVRDRSASLPAPRGRGPGSEPPAASSASTLRDEEGVAGYRQRLDEIEDRRRALIALNEQEFAAQPARLRANRIAIDTDSAQGRAALNADTNRLYTELRRHLTTADPNGGPAVTLPPATIMSRLIEPQQDAVTTQVNANIEGRKPSTDPQNWYGISQGLMADDASERRRWASKSLVPFMGRLSDEDFAALEKLQTVVRTNDGGAEQNRLQAITRMANRALRSVGIDPTPQSDATPPGSHAAQAASFHRALQDKLSAFETTKGRKATAGEAYDIVNAQRETAIKSGWLEASNRGATVASDIPSVDSAMHEPGAQLAQAEPSPETGSGRMEMRLDFARLRRMREEEEQREAAERSAALPGGSNGAPATEPYPGSTAYEEADAQAGEIAAEQTAEESAANGSAPPTEPLPASPEYRAAETEARKLDEGSWEDLGIWGQLRVAFERLDTESKKTGATFGIDSGARRLEKVLELQRRRDAGEALNVTEKQYLLRNRNVASDLAAAIARLQDAQRRLDELPASDPLRQLFEAQSAAEAARLLRQHPGRIARAIGVESLPALTLSLIAGAALGPIGSAIVFTGSSGLEGYANGLIGALAEEGVDVSDAGALTAALQDNALMERVRDTATTEGAIAAGVSAIGMAFPFRLKRAPLSLAMKVPPLGAKGRGFESFWAFKDEIGHAPKGYAWHHIVEQTPANIERFGATNIHNTNNLVLLPRGPGSIHNELTKLYGSKADFSEGLRVRRWLSKKDFEEQAKYGRAFIKQERKRAK